MQGYRVRSFVFKRDETFWSVRYLLLLRINDLTIIRYLTSADEVGSLETAITATPTAITNIVRSTAAEMDCASSNKDGKLNVLHWKKEKMQVNNVGFVYHRSMYL